jgi:predicted transcriptional regulator
MSKQEVINIINDLPDDVTFEDVIYKLYVANSIKSGLEDISAGNTRTHDEVRKLFAQ